MNFLTQEKQSHRHRKQTWLPGESGTGWVGKERGERNWEVGTYTHYYT